MKEKCTKYESIFTFRSEQELEEHIKNCPDCQAEQDKMDKVSDLLQEVRPYYIHKRKESFGRMKIACILGLGLFVGVLLGHFAQYLMPTTAYNNSSSADTTASSFNEYGMPVDNYGLITVN